MLDKYVVFCSEPPEFRIEDGLVHVTDRSGKLEFERVMSIHSFKRSLRKAEKLMREWEAESRGTVLPLRKNG